MKPGPVAAVVAAAMIASTGCGSCKDDKKHQAADEPAPRSATVKPQRPAAGKGRDPALRGTGAGSAPTAVMTKLTVEEAAPALPAIPGTTVIDAPTAAPHGAQVHLSWCITAADQALALAAVRTGLTDSGWSEIHDRGQGARVAISADKPPYRISASISRSPRPGCSPADGRWFASVAMYKIASLTRPPALDDPAIRDQIVR